MDTQYHLANHCPLYNDLREDKDLNDDRDLVVFFQQVIDRTLEEDDMTEPHRQPQSDIGR